MAKALKYVIKGEGARTAVFVHGHKGNIHSLTPVATVFDEFKKVFIEAPLRISANEYSWYITYSDAHFFESKQLLLNTVALITSDIGSTVFVGFSQGGVMLTELLSELELTKLAILCSKVENPELHAFQDPVDSWLFMYVSLNDPIIPAGLGIESFMVLSKVFKKSLLSTDFSKHKLSAWGLRMLKRWLQEL
ncbi:MAG: hypothetical protein NZT61_05215 [Deltaproteobacteria bacterium]|nr:hypothetical protein [Deltaproteobacteria bacterium]MCX7952727.1 hypothetical protein [Deltaproteobacteria bacterium]